MTRLKPIYSVPIRLAEHGLAHLGRMRLAYRAGRVFLRYNGRTYDYPPDLFFALSDAEGARFDDAFAEAFERLRAFIR